MVGDFYVVIRVLNWHEHNPRNGVKKPWWFRWHNGLALQTKYLPLKQREIMAMVYIFSLCSENNSDVIEISWEHHQVFGRMSRADFIDACKILKETGTLSFDEAGHVRSPNEIRTEPVQVPLAIQEEKRGEERVYVDLPAEAGDPPGLPLLAQVWNELADPKLARVKRVSASRERHARNRWKEEPTREFWSDVIWKINQSSFCLGNNQRGWKADFDFLVRPDTAAKVLEGKYDNRGPQGPGPKRVNPEVERVNKIPTKPMRFE